MLTELQSADINQFFSQVDSFPSSVDVSITEYNTLKLIKILQEKEVMNACGITKNDFDYVSSVDIEFGKLTNDILKQTNLARSIEEYNELEHKMENTISGNLFLYAKQGALSVKALYYYKNKEYDKAITVTLECIALNEHLIELGIGTLYLRCIEQNKNISRVFFRDNKIESGYTLINNLLDYLFNGTEKNLFGNLVRYKDYWKRSPILRETYTYELFQLFAEDMIRFNLQNKVDFLPNQWYLNLDFEVNTSDRQIIYNWIYINKQLHEGNYKEYFDSITYFFQQPISLYYDMLKISILIDLTKVVRNSDYSEKEIIMAKLNMCLQEKLNSHKTLRESLSKSIFCYST